MRRHTFEPKWRNTTGRTVEIVEQPTKAWFDGLTKSPDEQRRQSFRFSLLADGSLYFGDAWMVLHADIMQWRGPGTVSPLFVGVVMRVGKGPWRVALVQYFMEGASEPERFGYAKKLLGQLDCWRAACAVLGENPFDAPQWGLDEA